VLRMMIFSENVSIYVFYRLFAVLVAPGAQINLNGDHDKNGT
jgi:hypothetical protein